MQDSRGNMGIERLCYRLSGCLSSYQGECLKLLYGVHPPCPPLRLTRGASPGTVLRLPCPVMRIVRVGISQGSGAYLMRRPKRRIGPLSPYGSSTTDPYQRPCPSPVTSLKPGPTSLEPAGRMRPCCHPLRGIRPRQHQSLPAALLQSQHYRRVRHDGAPQVRAGCVPWDATTARYAAFSSRCS